MSQNGFRSGAVVNRRVNRHVESLLPSQISDRKDYHFEGQRVFDPDRAPGAADSCLCYLEVYVGTDGRFEVYEDRRFDHGTSSEWHCINRVARTASGGTRSAPFEYEVRTTVELASQRRNDRSTVDWATLGADPIFGGIEAQAATLLAEKMAHRKASASGSPGSHHGSLSALGSLSNVIDSGRQLPVDWSDVDELLGPDATTIAATTGFDRLESDEKRREARQKGIDFLSDTLESEMASFEESLQADADPGGGRDGRSGWETLPPDMDPPTARAKLVEMHQQLREMRKEP